ncbi:protease-4 [Leeuwenhoekiella marinoflava DSM 3653]|uniref:Protease-4 n=3 Tax=Leeuwenhoekiella marinoflava TaxID=988 RepID=A0A4Q0PNE1_9FLAO|nr:protease-4 [Leeuwenhoekiella marinoflava]SHE95878.1 protease-4 [Leeuwenhoekiella marinoflava DSM 3653]
MKNTLLDELVRGEWLMSAHNLFSYRHFWDKSYQAPQTGMTLKEAAAEREAKMLSVYNDEMKPIRPNSIDEIPEGSVAVIHMVGPMIRYGSWYAWGADELVYQLDWANNIKNIKAIIVVIDGPGGSVSAISPFIDFALRKLKPVVAIMDNSLSLHRWIPDAIADYQIAGNTISARFGSVGVVSSWLDVRKYWEDMGIFEKEVYPDESTHKNEIWRKLKEDEEAGMQMLRDQLKPIAQKFQAAVKAAHPNLIEEEGVLTGRTFSAEDALRVNMIDAIGTMDDAFQKATLLADLQAAGV